MLLFAYENQDNEKIMSIASIDIKESPGVLQWLQRLGKIGSMLFIIGAYLLLFVFHKSEEVKTLSVVFFSIMFEAIPFMLVGSLIGGIVESFVSREKLLKVVPKGRILPIMLAAALGLVLPVCECAIVPVVHRLCRKGLPPEAAIAYLLGGPAVNPVVAFSTALAYKFDWYMVALRLLLGYFLAVVIALVVQYLLSGKKILISDTDNSHEHSHSCGCCSHGHDHGHSHAHSHSKGKVSKSGEFIGKLKSCVNHASEDFLGAGHYLVIGAFIAALAQTFIDRSFFTSFSAVPFLPVVMMMLLAILLNLCSETDAFIIASMRGLLPVSAQLAFMLTGPIFDLKLLLMYQRIFSKRTIFYLSITILLAVFAVCAVIEVLGGGV